MPIERVATAPRCRSYGRGRIRCRAMSKPAGVLWRRYLHVQVAVVGWGSGAGIGAGCAPRGLRLGSGFDARAAHHADRGRAGFTLALVLVPAAGAALALAAGPPVAHTRAREASV